MESPVETRSPSVVRRCAISASWFMVFAASARAGELDPRTCFTLREIGKADERSAGDLGEKMSIAEDHLQARAREARMLPRHRFGARRFAVGDCVDDSAMVDL